jgi:hypothetical protein
MKKLATLFVIGILLAGCASAAHQTMMGERGPQPGAPGAKTLVGQIEVLDLEGKPWDGNTEVCLSSTANGDKLVCDFATFERVKCPMCKDQPDFEKDRGYVFMNVPAGVNELRELRLSHSEMKVGEHSYTFYMRGNGFKVEPDKDVTNFGKMVFTLAKPENGANGAMVEASTLKLVSLSPRDTTALERYRGFVSGTIPTVNGDTKPYYFDWETFRMQVKLGTVVSRPTTVMVPVYMPRR